jgi:hypothetical protein
MSQVQQAVEQRDTRMLQALKHLPAAQTLDATLLADYLQQALLHGDARMGNALCEFPSVQQIPAVRVQQLLRDLQLLDCSQGRLLIRQLLKLPGALAMVGDTWPPAKMHLLVTTACIKYSMHQVQHASRGCCLSAQQLPKPPGALAMVSGNATASCGSL